MSFNQQPPPPACPYLGLGADPRTRQSQAAEEHRCFRAGNPRRIAYNHQNRFCLTPGFEGCPVYAGNQKARNPDSRPIGLPLIALTMAVLAAVLGIAAFMIASLVEEEGDGGRDRTVAASNQTEPTETATSVPTEEPEAEVTDQAAEIPTIVEATEEPEGGIDFRSYLVQEGDNVTIIAESFGVTPEEIIALNGLDEFGTIDPGETLLIPPALQ
jgi:LysM repeat protein